jgi:O-antigen/teichoic acid export membrane protein
VGIDSVLAKKGVTAFLWGTGGAFGRIFLQFGIQVVLARLLGPAEYGVFALGVIVVMMCTYFSDIGLAYGLIQKESVNSADVRFVWTWQWIMGLVVSGAVFFGASSLAAAFAKPETEFVFRWLSAVILINALTSPSTNLLKKALDFKVLQIGQLSSYLIGYGCVGIPLAAAGYGSASLVTAWVVQSIGNFAIVYARVRHPLAFKLWIPGGANMLGYGVTVLATNLINWVLNSADKVLVGRVFPAHTVGLYTTGFNLVNTPAAGIYGNLQSVVFSTCARLQGNRDALRAVFLRLLSLIALIAFPLFAIVGAGAELVMAGIYGVQWVEAAPILQAFSFVMPFLLVWGISTPILWNSGYVKMEFWLQVPMVLVWIAAFYAVAQSPPQIVAITAACLFTTRCIVIALAAGRVIHIPVGAVLHAVRGGFVLTVITATASALVAGPITELDVNAQVRLMLLLTIGGGTYLLSLLLFAPALIDKRLVASIAGARTYFPRWTDLLFRCLLRAGKR